jgi:hypothetical protein
MLGFSTSITYYAIAAAFLMGAYLIEKNLFGTTFERIMLVFSCVLFGAQAVGKTNLVSIWNIKLKLIKIAYAFY